MGGAGSNPGSADWSAHSRRPRTASLLGRSCCGSEAPGGWARGSRQFLEIILGRARSFSLLGASWLLGMRWFCFLPVVAHLCTRESRGVLSTAPGPGPQAPARWRKASNFFRLPGRPAGGQAREPLPQADSTQPAALAGGWTLLVLRIPEQVLFPQKTCPDRSV